jgi:hypothetical protein
VNSLELISAVTITSISLKGGNRACGYILGVFTQEKIGSIYAKAIHHEWSKSMFCRKRRLTVKNNEIQILLKKGDTIQKYIDYISEIINKIKDNMKASKHLRMQRCMKNVKLKRKLPSKVYCLAGCKTIKKAL